MSNQRKTGKRYRKEPCTVEELATIALANGACLTGVDGLRSYTTVREWYVSKTTDRCDRDWLMHRLCERGDLPDGLSEVAWDAYRYQRDKQSRFGEEDCNAIAAEQCVKHIPWKLVEKALRRTR